jgi:hypothetical protein
MFFEFRVNGEVALFNLAQVTRIQVTPPADDKSVVTFFFTDGRQESVPMSPSTVQKLYQAVPRPAIYGSGGMG